MTGRPDRFVVSDVDWQAIVDALQEGVGVLDEEGRILACNQAAAAILGRSREEVLGQATFSLGLDAKAEDGSPLEPDALPSVQAIRTGKRVREPVVGVAHTDGGTRGLSPSATPTGGDARAAAGVITVRARGGARG